MIQCLRLDLLPLWLSGVQASRVKEELREKLVRYQREAAFVLWEAFKPQILKEETAVDQASSDAAIRELQQIAEMGRAITQMAQQQIELQRQQQVLGQRIDKAGQIVRGIQVDITDIQVRLGTVEDKLHPHAYITEEQAAHISTVVKARLTRCYI
jgi:methionine synthase I (cobalamin-dependent)